jgi:YtkA-like
MKAIGVGLCLAVSSVGGALAQPVERAKATVDCRPTAERLMYDCAIALRGARSGRPLAGVEVTVLADMPSMAMAHNVRPVKAAPGREPGQYLARVRFEMAGEWALRLRLAGAIRDQVVTHVRIGEAGADPRKP